MTGSESRQFNFFCLPEEAGVLDKALERWRARTLLLPCREPQPRLAASVLSVDSECWLGVFLCPEELVSGVRFRLVEEQGYYVIDQIRSPVVEFARPFKDSTILRRSRLYVRCGYWEEDRWNDHPHQLLEFYDSLVAALRSTLLTKQRRLGGLLSAGAVEFERRGGVLSQV